MKSVLVIRCMALIVPLGAFINQLHPNPQLYYYKKRAATVQCERNGKNSFNEKFNSCARVCQNFVAVTCHETTQNR